MAETTKGCRYTGHEFGASYPDSVCVRGYLWDADSGDADPGGDGWLFTRGGDIPCPRCNAAESAAYHADQEADRGNEQ